MVSCRGLQFGDLPAGVGRKLLKENLAVLIGSPFQMDVPIDLVNGNYCAGKGPAVGSVHLQYPQAGVGFVHKGDGSNRIVGVDHHIFHGVLVKQMPFRGRDFGDDIAASPGHCDRGKSVCIGSYVAHNAFFRMADLEHRAGQGLFRPFFQLVNLNLIFFLGRFRFLRLSRFAGILGGQLHVCRDGIGVEGRRPHLLGAILTAPKEQGIRLPIRALVCGDHHRGGEFAAGRDSQLVVHLVEGHAASRTEMEIAQETSAVFIGQVQLVRPVFPRNLVSGGGVFPAAHKAGDLFVVFNILQNLGVIRGSAGVVPNNAVIDVAVCLFQGVQIHPPMHDLPDQHLSGHVIGDVAVIPGPVLHDMAQHIFLVRTQAGICGTAAHVHTGIGVKVGHVHTVGQFAADGGGGPGRFLLLEGMVVGVLPMGGNLLDFSSAGIQHGSQNPGLRVKFRLGFRFGHLRLRVGDLRLAGGFADFRQIVLIAGRQKLHIFVRQVGDFVHLGDNAGVG